MFATILGGIGLFLLGMTLMTDGLKTMAGDALKNLLSRFTGGTFSSILTGATITALIQSSSATTLMTIGFVSAGFLPFLQSIGVIIGANVGSTSTGWIVSLVGFKINMSVIALPLIGIGVFLKLFSKGRYTAQGIALAGFGLLFVGIDVLQDGMGDLATKIDLGAFAGGSIFHLFLLVAIGVVMTVVMQSSSAAVVTTLAALATGAIDFEQATALVIGQNVGTTVKAIMASIGGSVAVKRTALAHTLFNVLTAIVALIFLPIFIQGVYSIGNLLEIQAEATLLAVFHTLFNLVGVMLIAPFLRPFAKMIEKIYPEQGNPLTMHLDETVAPVTPVALEATKRTLQLITERIINLTTTIDKKRYVTSETVAELDDALNKASNFLKMINRDSQRPSSTDYERHISLLHVIDHLGRIISILQEKGQVETVFAHEQLATIANQLIESISHYNNEPKFLQIIEANSQEIAATRRAYRPEILKTTVISQLDIEEGIRKVQALQWLDRLAYHLWRSIYHLNQTEEAKVNLEELAIEAKKEREVYYE